MKYRTKIFSFSSILSRFFCLKWKEIAIAPPLRESCKIENSRYVKNVTSTTHPLAFLSLSLLRHSEKWYFSSAMEYFFVIGTMENLFITKKKFFLFRYRTASEERERERNKSNKHIMACLLCIHTLEKSFLCVSTPISGLSSHFTRSLATECSTTDIFSHHHIRPFSSISSLPYSNLVRNEIPAICCLLWWLSDFLSSTPTYYTMRTKSETRAGMMNMK